MNEENKIWHPISEMPESNEKILLHKVDGDYENYVLGYFRDGKVWFGSGEPCRLKLFKEYAYLKDIVKCSRQKQEEVVSGDIEEEIHQIAGDYEQVEVAWNKDFDFIARHFANWQKQIMINGGIDATIDNDIYVDLLYADHTPSDENLYIHKQGLKVGDKVKVIFIKDE